jgi:hypothetical protein
VQARETEKLRCGHYGTPAAAPKSRVPIDDRAVSSSSAFGIEWSSLLTARPPDRFLHGTEVQLLPCRALLPVDGHHRLRLAFASPSSDFTTLFAFEPFGLFSAIRSIRKLDRTRYLSPSGGLQHQVMRLPGVGPK